jgi:hypothetical protein
VPTRRYHGLLIAALPAPLGRTMMFNQLHERVVRPDGTAIALQVKVLAGRPAHAAEGRLAEFRWRRTCRSGDSRPGALLWRSA